MGCHFDELRDLRLPQEPRPSGLVCFLSAEWALHFPEPIVQEPRLDTGSVERVPAAPYATNLIVRLHFAHTNRALRLRPLLHYIAVVPEWAYLRQVLQIALQVLQIALPLARSEFHEFHHTECTHGHVHGGQETRHDDR